MKTLAIIMTAYKAEKFILETLNALSTQILPTNWKVKYYIGIDGCKTTKEFLDQKKIDYYFSKENVGTYILSNSLLEKANSDDCEMFCRFDSDDIPGDYYLFYGIKHTLKYHFTRPFVKKFIDSNSMHSKQKLKKAFGSVFFDKKVLEDLGGYHHYRVSCDAFFIKRANKLGYVKPLSQDAIPMYWHRIHADSLTQKKETGYKSTFRIELEQKMNQSLSQGEFKINPITTSLNYIEHKNN